MKTFAVDVSVVPQYSSTIRCVERLESEEGRDHAPD